MTGSLATYKQIEGINSFLAHHGIEGQKWGVRNGPPYPIDHSVLKKGTRINSVSSVYTDSEKYRKNGRWMYTYNPDDEWDSKVYKGPFSKYLVMYRGAQFVKEHEFETIRDLKMPTKQQRIEEFKKLDRKKVSKDIETIRKLLVDQNIGSEQEQENYRNFDVNKMKTEEDYKIGYDIFSHAMEASWYYPSTREYMKNISKKYDAMVDDNNQGVYNDAHDPIIIFKANEVLKSIGNDPLKGYLTANEIVNNTEDVRSELAKVGRNVKL